MSNKRNHANQLRRQTIHGAWDFSMGKAAFQQIHQILRPDHGRQIPPHPSSLSPKPSGSPISNLKAGEFFGQQHSL